MFEESNGETWKDEEIDASHFRFQCYSIDGKLISIEEWASLFELPEYKRIDFTETEQYTISTIWLGLDHSGGLIFPRARDDKQPIIFESMVFSKMPDTESGSIEGVRYTTLEEAQYGHLELVAKYRKLTEGVILRDMEEAHDN